LLPTENLNDKTSFVGDQITTPVLDFKSVTEHMMSTDVYQYVNQFLAAVKTGQKMEMSYLFNLNDCIFVALDTFELACIIVVRHSGMPTKGN
jgi:hypothetical protein